MSRRLERTAAWMYRGVWGVLVRWFRVPDQPPPLPVGAGERVESIQPAEGYLRYLKFQFWVVLLTFDVAVMAAWAAVAWEWPVWGAVLFLPVLAVAIVPDIVAYIAIHLRYDTMWYTLSDRSMRLRRGIWIIEEVTITYENIQNVEVSQGPLQRWFGIANVVVTTAGGGSSGPRGRHTGGHRGLVEGVAHAHEIRDRIMDRLRRSRSAGLGDDRDEEHAHGAGGAWGPAHLTLLREIRDTLRAANASAAPAA